MRDKERLQALRANVHVLTLTATPIPRTLNMALGGLRDLSLITTPPAERLAIKTFVIEWHAPTLREAVLRELRRGGQIYFVHNEVRTIDKIAAEVQALVPEASVRIGHGQMRERELEQLMVDFYHRRFNLLVCTTIIESGIDVPTANTIMINRADHMGLAQLHQLRGRVGRSHHRAYAYLIAPPRQALARDAAKRLEAIESMEELGAGFVLATHDLEIRGAGELLGEQQSGQMTEVGLSHVPRHARARGEGAEGRAASRRSSSRSPRPPRSSCACRRSCRRPTSATCTCGCRSTSASPPPTSAERSMSSPPSCTTASARCRRPAQNLLRIAKLKLARARARRAAARSRAAGRLGAVRGAQRASSRRPSCA